jgi:hypothetical protein
MSRPNSSRRVARYPSRCASHATSRPHRCKNTLSRQVRGVASALAWRQPSGLDILQWLFGPAAHRLLSGEGFLHSVFPIHLYSDEFRFWPPRTDGPLIAVLAQCHCINELSHHESRATLSVARTPRLHRVLQNVSFSRGNQFGLRHSP